MANLGELELLESASCDRKDPKFMVQNYSEKVFHRLSSVLAKSRNLTGWPFLFTDFHGLHGPFGDLSWSCGQLWPVPRPSVDH